jgi:hypothetical protein
MDLTLQYFEGCPNWKTTNRHLMQLRVEGFDLSVGYELVDSHEMAIEKGFRGSPTVLIDGVDPFADPDAPVGLACRIYRTEHGPAGSPTLDVLREAISSALAGLHGIGPA